jgi:hypothetical protein
MIETGLTACFAFSGVDIQPNVAVSHDDRSERPGVLRRFHAKHTLVKSSEKRVLITYDRQVP